MDKNFNLENAKNIIAEVSGVPVNTTFGSITKPIDLLLEVIDMSADLIALIREEIFDRWADEIDDLDEDFMEDEDYEPDEFFSD